MADLPSNFSCPETYSSLLTIVASTPVSGHELKEVCPEVCEIAWGSGNPDLSGIGVYVSYMIQGALTLLFHFPFILLYIFSPNKRRRVLVKLFESFFKSLVLFNAAVLLAALVRAQDHNVEGGYEQVFLEFLVYYVSVSLLTAQSTPLIINMLEILLCGPDDFTWHFSWTNLLVFGLSFAFNFIGASYKLFKRSNRESFRDLYAKLVDMCDRYAKLSPPSAWVGYLWFASSFLMVAECLVAFYFHRRRARRQRCPKAIAKAATFSTVLVFMFVLISCGWLLKKLRDCRNDLRDIMGDGFADDSWTFGQVLGISLWAETIVAIIWKASRATLKRTKKWQLRRTSTQDSDRQWSDSTPEAHPEEAKSGETADGLLWQTK